MTTIDLQKLSVFVEIAQAGSFTRAACQLALAQSALSRKMRDLEADLGVQLFHRNGRGVVLTEAGDRFLERATQLLDGANLLVEEMSDYRSTSLGSVRLGVPPSVGCVLLTPLIKDIATSCPHVKMSIVESYSGDIQERLLNGRMDIGLLHGARRVPTLFTEELITEDMFAIGPAGDPLTSKPTIHLAQLSHLPLVLPSRPHGIRILIDDASTSARVPLTVNVELNGLAPMKELIAAGISYGILPSSAVLREVAEGRLSAARIIEPAISRTLVLAMAHQRSASRATQDVGRAIQETVSLLAKQNRWSI